MRIFYCKRHGLKWPATRRRAIARAPRKTVAHLGAWPAAFLSWPKLTQTIRRVRGPHEVMVMNIYIAGSP